MVRIIEVGDRMWIAEGNEALVDDPQWCAQHVEDILAYRAVGEITNDMHEEVLWI